MAVVRAANSSGVEAEVGGHQAGGVGGVGGLVALAAVGLRGEVGAVGLDQQAVARGGGEDGAQVSRAAEGRDAGDREVEAEGEGGLGEGGAAR